MYKKQPPLTTTARAKHYICWLCRSFGDSYVIKKRPSLFSFQKFSSEKETYLTNSENICGKTKRFYGRNNRSLSRIQFQFEQFWVIVFTAVCVGRLFCIFVLTE